MYSINGHQQYQNYIISLLSLVRTLPSLIPHQNHNHEYHYKSKPIGGGTFSALRLPLHSIWTRSRSLTTRRTRPGTKATVSTWTWRASPHAATPCNRNPPRLPKSVPRLETRLKAQLRPPRPRCSRLRRPRVSALRRPRVLSPRRMRRKATWS